MNIIEHIEHDFKDYLERLFDISSNLTSNITFTINTDESKAQFGDMSSNAAMILAKELQKRPLEVAELIAGGFTHQHVKEVALHPPGFLNFYLTEEALQELVRDMHEKKKNFFKLYLDSPTQTCPTKPWRSRNINIEFVSANPTGPLHVGHGRGAIIGDVLASVLTFAGQKATKEFYINNAGSQMAKLGMSLKIRCQQAVGQEVTLPEEAYHGQYLCDLANTLIKAEGESVVEKDISFFAKYAEKHLLAEIKKTLELYGVTFDVWFPETKLHEGEIDKALNILHKNGYLYEKDDATWFKATAFGDDKDRVLVKADGEYTYAAADVAYMQDKIDRGFDHLVMVLGHDHHSYLMRLHCIQKALGLDQTSPPGSAEALLRPGERLRQTGQCLLDIILYQLVKMKQSGDLVRMSKRAGNIVTLRDVIETVGKDVARFFFLNRKADAQLEFDVDLALKKTEENPVYYVQYAYVRTKSILEKAKGNIAYDSIRAEDAAYIGQAEGMLVKKMVALRSILRTICETNQTHLLTYYVLELANIFHSYYSKNRVMEESDIKRSRGRLLLIASLKETFETVLNLLGISCPERM